MEPHNRTGTTHAHALTRIVERIEATFDESVGRAAEAVRQQVPSYRAEPVDELGSDLVEHVRAIFRVLLTSLTEDRLAGPDDFAATRAQAVRRVRQGVPLAAVLQAFRVGQLTLWEEVLAAVDGDPSARDAALSIVERIMHLIETCSAEAADAYLEAERHQLAEIDRLRRDLLEDLLARADVSASTKRAGLQTAGLDSGRPIVVVLASPAAPLPTGRSLADALSVLGRADGTAPGLMLARQNEIVGVLPMPPGGLDMIVAGLERGVTELAGRRVALAIGVSTARGTLSEVPDAYAEAWAARDGLGTGSGVLALSMLDIFDYLILRADETARRLVRPKYRRFVEEDTAKGGPLVHTLLEYVANDLNATAAAKRMHMHVNTVYYRLERITERSGCDLRRFTELQELVVAVRLLQAASSPHQWSPH